MFKRWLLATRPWSFTAAFIPVALGTALAWSNDRVFHPLLFALCAVGGIALQAGTNLFNTWGDFKSGVDTKESSLNVPHLVLGWMKPEQIKRAGIIAFAVAAACGVFLVYERGWPILALGILGIVGGYTYTAGPMPYKYKGIGSIMVFFLMGPAMVWGSYYAQTGPAGQSGVSALLASIPVAFLVSAILHANDLRDLGYDHGAGISTFALILGPKRAFSHYTLLIVGAFVSLAALSATQVLHWLALLPLLMLPRMRSILLEARAGQRGDLEKLARLEPDTGAFHLQFGVLLAVGVAVSKWLIPGVHS